jgi:hypothetical protein
METPHQSLVAAVERAIDDADPIGLLEGGAPADEYAPEIGTIGPRVLNAYSVEEVTTVLHEEFVRWFDDYSAGPRHARSSSGQDLEGSTRIPKGRLTPNSWSGCRAEELELPQPPGDSVSTGAVLVHQLQVINSKEPKSQIASGCQTERLPLRIPTCTGARAPRA